MFNGSLLDTVTLLLRDWLLDPLALVFLLALLLTLRALWRRRGGAFGWLCFLLLLLVVSAPRIVNPLVALLEERHPANAPCDSPAPIVVLGGGVDSRIDFASRFEFMETATLARVAAAARLARADEGSPILLAGGARRGVSEAAVMADFLESLGVPETRLHLEDQSFNTASNAINVVAMLDNLQLPRNIRLVTSALHMPRAHAVFTRLGVDACPISVDRQSLTGLPWYALMPQTTALVKFDRLMHEAIAALVYRIQGFV